MSARHFLGDKATLISLNEGGSIAHTLQSSGPNGGDLLQSVFFTNLAPTSLDTPFDAAGSFPGAGVVQVIGGPVSGDPSTILSLTVETVRVAGVPEPSAWALVILGFGAAGAMLRRRPRSALAT